MQQTMPINAPRTTEVNFLDDLTQEEEEDVQAFGVERTWGFGQGEGTGMESHVAYGIQHAFTE